MKIELSDAAKKDLKRLPKPEGKKIARKIFQLGQFPFAGKKLSGELDSKYSLRSWPYRIIYKIYKKEEIVYILIIEHRQGVYK